MNENAILESHRTTHKTVMNGSIRIAQMRSMEIISAA